MCESPRHLRYNEVQRLSSEFSCISCDEHMKPSARYVHQGLTRVWGMECVEKWEDTTHPPGGELCC